MAKFQREQHDAAPSGDQKRDAAFNTNGKESVKWELEALLTRVSPPVVGPKTAVLSAAWLVDYLFEPPHEGEHIYSVPVADGVRWATPYRDRAVYLAGKLVRLPPEDQDAIAAHREDGVFWRGDSMDMLRRIAETHDLMAGMSTEQRAEHVARQWAAKRIGA